MTCLSQSSRNYEFPHGAFSTPRSHPFWAQIFSSRSCFQIPLACIPPLMQETMFPTVFNKITKAFTVHFDNNKTFPA